MTKSVGVFCGKFLPPHIGHVESIKKAKNMCDILFVVLCENVYASKQKCDDAKIDYISVEQRISWLKNYFEYDSNINILFLDETKIGSLFSNPNVWKKQLENIISQKIDIKFAGEEYKELNEKYFPECKFVGFDRSEIPISSSLLRDKYEEYKNYLIPECRSYFDNKQKTEN